jgi:hypothetical protein
MIFDEKSYFNLFEVEKNSIKAIGEATVTYLFLPEIAIPNIKKHLGDPRIIIILRDPIKRAFSQYSFARELGFEKECFINALKLEEKRLNNNWSSLYAYVNQGMYLNQIDLYLKEFKNVHIIIFEEFIQNPELELKKMYSFLGVDPNFVFDLKAKRNVSGVPRFQILHNLIIRKSPLKSFVLKLAGIFFMKDRLRNLAVKARKINQSKKLVISDEELIYIRTNYNFEIEKIEKKIGRNINHWIR